MSSSNDNDNNENSNDNKDDVEIFVYKAGMTNKDVPINAKRVKIDSEVKRIEKRAFYHKQELYEVDFSEATSLEEIGEWAFHECASLLEVDIPSSVNKIQEGAFFKCSNLAKVKMMEGLKVIGRLAFFQCKSLSEVEIPSTVERIEVGAFALCEKLVSVKNLEEVKAMGNNLFYGCVALLGVDGDIFLYKEGMTKADVAVGNIQRVKIDSNVKKIEEKAFSKEKELHEVDFSEATSLEEIRKDSFYGCSSLLDVDLPSSVNTIEDRAFACCEKLASVKNLDRVKTVMGDNVFYGCKALLGVDKDDDVIFFYKTGMKKVDIPKDVKRVKIDSEVKRIEKLAFNAKKELYEVDFSEATSLKEIGDGAFMWCPSLLEVDIPSSVNKVEDKAFYDCIKLTSVKGMEGVNVMGDNVFYYCEALLGADGVDIFVYKTGMTQKDVPNDVKRVKIDSNVKKIEEKAFSNKKELHEVDFSEATSLEEIGKDSFYGCSSLSDVDLPSSVNTIEDRAFACCEKLVSVKNLDRVKTVMGDNVFYGCKALLGVDKDDDVIFFYKTGMKKEDIPKDVKRVKIDSEVKRIERIAFNAKKELYEVDFSEATSLKEIGDGAFMWCPSLLEVDIPSSVNKVEDEAFKDCINLTSVKGMEGVNVMGDNVFYYCYALLGVDGVDIFVYKTGMTQKDVPNDVKRVKIDSNVKKIEEKAFSNKKELHEVDFSEATSLEEVGWRAFSPCESLLEVDIPSSVNKVEDKAFYDCFKLMSVKGMEGVNVMGDNVFYGCKALLGVDGVDIFLYKTGMTKEDVPKKVKRVKIDSNVKRIENEALSAKEELYEVDFSEASSLKEIGKSAFHWCPSLLEVDIPSSVNTIEGRAFQKCFKLTSVKGMEVVNVMGDNVFYGCKALLGVDGVDIFLYITGMTKEDVPKDVERVKIDSNVKRIENEALSAKEELYEVDFSEASSLKEIGKYAFDNCKSMLKVDIPSSVNTIEGRAFQKCFKLTSVKGMEGVNVMGDNVFYGCKALLGVDGVDIFVYKTGMKQKDVPKNTKRVKIDSNVKRIEEDAFDRGEELHEVDFSEATSLEEIGGDAFYGCSSLLEADFPSSVNEIEGRAFSQCFKLTSVKGMEGVKVMGMQVFYKCHALLEAELLSPLLSKIPSETFFTCYNLTTVKMAEGLKVIGTSAFVACVSLSEVEIPSSVNTIEEKAFQGCQKLMSVKVKGESQLKVVGKMAFACCQALSEVDIPPSVNKNVNGVFGGCPKLMMEDHEPVFLYKAGMTKKDVPKDVMRVKIDSNVKRIEQEAFYEPVDDLYEVDFSKATSLEEIGRLAFYLCCSLSEVEIPSWVNTIENEAFRGCYIMTNVKMVEGLEVIGRMAFRDCHSLLEAEIPSTVEKIEAGAFYECRNLARVKMMEGLTFIGDGAFKACGALAEVDVPASVAFVGTGAFYSSKCVTSMLGNNLALGIRLRVTHPNQTQETIPLDKLVTIYAHKPIKAQELQDPTNQKEIDLLQSTKSKYMKLITSLNISTKNPLLSFQEQNGWVQFVTNYDDYVSKEEESKVLAEFLNTGDKEIVKALAFAKDRYGRLALKSAVPSVGDVFRKRLLFQGRYDIAPGSAIHKSVTCIVVKAEDMGMKKYYEEIFGWFKQQDLDYLDLVFFGAALKLMHVVSDEESKMVDDQIKEYFERVDLDNSGKIWKDEFVQFCLAQFGNNVVLKFMRNKDQFERELDGRKMESSRDDVDDSRLKDDLLAKYVVSVIRSYDQDTVDTATLEDTVAPYLSKEEEPEKYCHVLVMPYGDRNLDTIFRSERPDLTKVRDMLKDVGNALVHLHEKRNLIHGDLKMLNVVRVQERLSLIDLDASAKIGSDYAGAKFSSGVLPPEMIHQLKDSGEASKLEEYYKSEVESERVKRAPKYSSTFPPRGYVVKSYLNTNGTERTDGLPYDLIKADPSLDVWSFGVLLYAMCTGEQSLFKVSRDDDFVDGNGLRKLLEWDPDNPTFRRNLKLKVSDSRARDLIVSILKKDPKERPTMREVLDHAFFSLDKDDVGMDGIEKLQKTVDEVLATGKETQIILKRGIENLQESMQMMMQRQIAMQNMLKHIIVGQGFPPIFAVIPQEEEGKGRLSRLLEKVNVESWMCEKTKARICFVCPISLQPVIGSDGKAIGYDLILPKEWVKKFGPAILIGLKMLQVGFAVGRGFGLPFPSLGDASEKVSETLGEASELLSNMHDIAMEQLELDEDDDLADLFVDKLSETTKEVMAADMKISDDGRKKIQASYEGIGKLVKDEKFERCGLVEATCKEDGTTEFVHPDLKALYEKKGQSVLKTMGPEMIDNAAAAARAGARNLSKSEGDKAIVQKVTADVTRSEAEPPALQPNPIEPMRNIESLLDARFSEMSKQVHEVQQSMSIRDTMQLSESTRSGGSIVHEGFFQMQSQSFPHRWKERQFFLYDDLSIKHFPASGQWLRRSSGRWQAKKAENGDGLELIVSGGKVCTLRVSEKTNYSSKSPERKIEEWIAMLNSPPAVSPPPPLTDTNTKSRDGQSSKAAATSKRMASTGEIISS